jgi:hypothetical protein
MKIKILAVTAPSGAVLLSTVALGGTATADGSDLAHQDNTGKGRLHNLDIHHGEQAAHECPTFKDDANHDFRLNVAEGLPKYGPIAISLTTKGDTSPASALTVDRFSTAPKSTSNYQRTVKTGKAGARAIRGGEGVLVVHGVDYTTDPAVCGVLR